MMVTTRATSTALAIHGRRRLFIARDRLGIKPIYYYYDGHTFLFGSEIKAVLAYPGIKPEFNRETLAEYLAFGYISEAESMYAGIRKLPPGHTLRLEEGGQLEIFQYWDLDGPVDDGALPGEYYVGRYRELLEECVSSHLMSDVPLGMFLSGGIDSSAIAAIMARMIDRPLQTFSVAFKERAFNELEYAREVARAIGADSHEIVIDDNDFFGALPRLVWHEDEPIAHSSSVPLYFVSALARQHVTVVLTGEGSDELLAGYGKYPRVSWNWRAGTVYERMMPAAMRWATRSGSGRTPRRVVRPSAS